MKPLPPLATLAAAPVWGRLTAMTDSLLARGRVLARVVGVGCGLAAASVFSQTLLYTNSGSLSSGSGVDTVWTDPSVVLLPTNGSAGLADPTFWLPVNVTNTDSSGGVHCQVQLYRINNAFWDSAAAQPLLSPYARRFNFNVRWDTQHGSSTNGANQWDINLLQFWQWATKWTSNGVPQQWVNGQPEFMLWVQNNSFGRKYQFKIYTDVPNATNNKAATEWLFQNTTDHPVSLEDGNWHLVSVYGSMSTDASNSCVTVWVDGIPVNWDRLTKTSISSNGTRGTPLVLLGPGTNITGCATLPNYGDFRPRFGAYSYHKFGTLTNFGLYLDSIAILTDTVFVPLLPPTLAPIPDQNLVAGAILWLTNSATDPNTPPQALGFSLPVKPVGASINPANGLISWRPLIAQSGTSNEFVVVVTNSSGLAATQSFWVAVGTPQPPVITRLVRGTDGIRLTVAGSAGPDYLIQGSTNLAGASWQNLFFTNAPPLPLQWEDTNTTRPQFFYRVGLGP